MKSTISVKAIRLIVLFILFTTHQLMGFQKRVCQYDDLTLRFTGETKIESGKFSRLYKCVKDHYYWLVDEVATSPKPRTDPYQELARDIGKEEPKGMSGFLEAYDATRQRGAERDAQRAKVAAQRESTRLEREKLKMMESAMLAKMTPEERRIYHEYQDKQAIERQREAEERQRAEEERQREAEERQRAFAQKYKWPIQIVGNVIMWFLIWKPLLSLLF